MPSGLRKRGTKKKEKKKRESNTGVFLLMFENLFRDTFLYRTPPVAASLGKSKKNDSAIGSRMKKKKIRKFYMTSLNIQE